MFLVAAIVICYAQVEDPTIRRLLRAHHRNDLYAVLGVRPRASQSSIRKAYRSLAKRVHPDKNRDPRAAAAFDVLRDAYEELMSPARREAYDRRQADLARELRDLARERRRQVLARMNDVVARGRRFFRFCWRYAVNETPLKKPAQAQDPSRRALVPRQLLLRVEVVKRRGNPRSPKGEENVQFCDLPLCGGEIFAAAAA